MWSAYNYFRRVGQVEVDNAGIEDRESMANGSIYNRSNTEICVVRERWSIVAIRN